VDNEQTVNGRLIDDRHHKLVPDVVVGGSGSSTGGGGNSLVSVLANLFREGRGKRTE
jgi:hypothetical protein